MGVRGSSRGARRGHVGEGRAGEEHWRSGRRKCSAQLWTEEDEGEAREVGDVGC